MKVRRVFGFLRRDMARMSEGKPTPRKDSKPTFHEFKTYRPPVHPFRDSSYPEIDTIVPAELISSTILPEESPSPPSSSSELLVGLTAEARRQTKKSSSPKYSIQDLIMYEDSSIVTVYKPPTVLSQGDLKGSFNLLEAVQNHLLRKARLTNPTKRSQFLALIHRLDRPCSGIMVFAKNPIAAAKLNFWFSRRFVRKEYVCVVNGSVQGQGGNLHHLLSKTNAEKISVIDLPANHAGDPSLSLQGGDSVSRVVFRRGEGGHENDDVIEDDDDDDVVPLKVKRTERGERWGDKRDNNDDYDDDDDSVHDNEISRSIAQAKAVMEASGSVVSRRKRDFSVSSAFKSSRFSATGDISESTLSAGGGDRDRDRGTAIHIATTTSTTTPKTTTATTSTTTSTASSPHTASSPSSSGSSAASRQRVTHVEAKLSYKLVCELERKEVLGQVKKVNDKAQSLVRVHTLTGRKHQIRAQLSHIGHPVVGDTKYGAPQKFKARDLALHAYALSFKHPVSHETLLFTAMPPRCWTSRFGADVVSRVEEIIQSDEDEFDEK